MAYHYISKNWFAVHEKLRFLVIALLNSIFRYAVFVLLIYLFSSGWYQLILFFTWILSSFTAFAALKFLVFQTDGNHLREYMRSVVTLAIGYVLNVGLLWLFVNIWSLPILLSQALALALIVISNYLLFRYFAFRS